AAGTLEVIGVEPHPGRNRSHSCLVLHSYRSRHSCRSRKEPDHMRRIRGWLMRALAPVLGTWADRELDAELHSHLQHHIDDKIRAGLTPDEARRQAWMALGGFEQTKDAY